MNKIYVFLAEGFETIEALGVVDVCRRAALPVVTVSVTGDLCVTSSHHVSVTADALIEDTDLSDASLLFLPGGLPGSTNLNDHEPLKEAILKHYNAGKALAAICAAPLVYGQMGLLKGKRTTCYPGFETYLTGACPTGELVVEDGQFLLGKGPAAVLKLGFAIVERFCGPAKAKEVAEGMLYPDAIAAGI